MLAGVAFAGCGNALQKEANVTPADESGCNEPAPSAARPAAIMVNRSWLGRYPTLQLAVSECFRDSDSGALLLSVRVSRKGAVCEKVLQRDSTGRPASVSCFLDHFVRWEMTLGAYRLLLDLTAKDRV